MTDSDVAVRPTTTLLERTRVTQTSGRRNRWRHVARTGGLAALGVGILLATWSALYATGWFPQVLFPSVPQILSAGGTLWTDGTLQADLTASLRRAALGFLIGGAAGIVVGAVTARTSAGKLVLQPVLRLFAPVPTIALVPLAILWLGLGEGSKILMVSLGVFVPVWINAHSGISSTPRDYLKVSRVLGAGQWQNLTRVVLPEALPDIVTGLRVGAAMAFVLIVVAEMTGTTNGIGYRIAQAQLFSQADRLLFCLVVLGVLGAATDRLIAAVAGPFIAWAEAEQ